MMNDFVKCLIRMWIYIIRTFDNYSDVSVVTESMKSVFSITEDNNPIINLDLLNYCISILDGAGPKEDAIKVLLAYKNDKRFCRKCKCSDSFACQDGCSWVEIDLCSKCATNELKELCRTNEDVQECENCYYVYTDSCGYRLEAVKKELGERSNN